MPMVDRYALKSLEAESFLKEKGVSQLPISPFAIAEDLDIEVRPIPAENRGVSGMLLRHGDEFAIGYATHVDNEGFQRFSVAHELGHYLLPGHVDHLVPDSDGLHQSKAGFVSSDRYELEADHFAAGLLMPSFLVRKELRDMKDTGLPAIEALRLKCRTSLTATAIQYAKLVDIPAAIVVSSGKIIDYCFMSEELKELPGLDWIKQGALLPKGTISYKFNGDHRNVLSAAQAEGTSNLQDWFGSKWNMDMIEEVAGLGSYEKTLTVLTVPEGIDVEELEEDEDLEESWTPRFHR